MPTVTANSNFQFPECLSYGPTYRVRQLIPPNTKVSVKIAAAGGGGGSTTGSSQKPQAVIIRNEDSVLVNQELVKSGFAKVRPITNPELEPYLDSNVLKKFQEDAQNQGIGIFKRCDDITSKESFVAEFEPLEFDVETQWGDDGGKQILKKTKDTQVAVTPENPGDVKGNITPFLFVRLCLCVCLLVF